MQIPAQNQSERKTGIHLSPWVRDLAMKLLPWVLITLFGGIVGLVVDNINNKKDLAHERWRNDQQDGRAERLEHRAERNEEAIASIQEMQGEFNPEVLNRLDELLEKERRRR